MQIILGHRTFHTLFLLYFGLLAFLGRVAWTGLKPDPEAWYAQKARELLEHGNLFVLTFHGVPAFEHAPFPIWMDALAFRLFGVSSYTAALPSALFAAGTLVLLYHFSLSLFKDRWVAFLAGLILLFPGCFLEEARRGQSEIMLTFMGLLALYAFWRSRENPRWFILYGLATGGAMLTHPVAGLAPFITGLAFVPISGQVRRIRYLALGLVPGLALGLSWPGINGLRFGDAFFDVQLRSLVAGMWPDPLSLTGSWVWMFLPWLPLSIIGYGQAVREAVREKKSESLLLVLWGLAVAVPGVIGNGAFLLPVFPLLALVAARTLGGWLKERGRGNLSLAMICAMMVTVFVVGATGIEKGSALQQNSPILRDLAPPVNLNTPPGEGIGNYRLGDRLPPGPSGLKATGPIDGLSESRVGLLFFADRYLEDPIDDPEALVQAVARDPARTWLTRIEDYRVLEAAYPGRLFLIHGNPRFAYFTSHENRYSVSRDYSRPGLTFIQ